MKKGSFNPVTAITAVLAVIIFYIIYSGKVSSSYILPVLGAACLAYGIYGMVKYVQNQNNPDSTEEISIMMPVMEMMMGLFLLVIGIIEVTHMQLPQEVWNYILIVFVAVAAVSVIVLRRKR